ncbi:predicted protein [Aspergillus terreus NIH2624]|uniref:T6SS Phospholipase effector Tle1-like catalytic domain-containing protein n=1 Tax=Aspergillus terreus (strain NIH 2624 / FGSC A1156) TaxID=341663 RepID=Q0CZ98_ASPTN|nr:uncharacterized protein ATEG_00986 [Aspergillus terreus NIH2624]EAU37743.1 predicted protein [Aspergillus terreus NIH2624]
MASYTSRLSKTLGRPAPSEKPTKPLVLLCDGTWCGRETDTHTNILELARIMGVEENPDRVFYLEGVGIGAAMPYSYVFNGVTAQDIASQCIEAYKFIVKNYTYPDHEIWMFGLSRGAYLARAVAGMINNCGIVKPVKVNGVIDELQTHTLCEAVYNNYRSPYPINRPHSVQSQIFRQEKSWPLIGDEDPDKPMAPRFIPPVKFMGLFDTVGSLGLPNFTGGLGLDWPAFYDQNVSSAVENVYHAVSLHDRMYAFQPCLVSRNENIHRQGLEDFGVTKQEWLPGVHYDLGRQRFRFLREFGGGYLEDFLARFKFASKVIEPNEVLADFALRWMLFAIRAHNPQARAAYHIIPEIDTYIEYVTNGIIEKAQVPGRIGDGDVYGHVLEFAPFGSAILDIMRALRGTREKVSAIYQLFFNLRDRLIPDRNATVYDFRDPDPGIGRSIMDLGVVCEHRYPSKTYTKWELMH